MNLRPIIRHPQHRQLQEIALECIEFTLESGEPHCMSIEGQTGVGKSTFLQDTQDVIQAAYPEVAGRIRTINMPDNPTLKSTISQMLFTIGSPDAATKKYMWEAKQRLISELNRQQVRLIFIDDFQHLVTSHHNNTRHTNIPAIAEFLKATIKETGIPFVIIGIEGEVEQVLTQNQQLSRLFAAREKLHPLVLQLDDDASIREFDRIIRQISNILEIDLDDEGNRIGLLERVQYGTQGVMANMFNLLRQAQQFAAQSSETNQIRREDLAKAFNRRLAKHTGLSKNPFDSSYAKALHRHKNSRSQLKSTNSGTTIEDIFSNS